MFHIFLTLYQNYISTIFIWIYIFFFKFIVKRGDLNLDSLYKGQEAIVPSYETPN